MNFPKIAFKIEDRVYKVDATDGPAIRKIPEKDREHLITLLSAIQKQHNLASNAAVVEPVAGQSSPTEQAANPVAPAVQQVKVAQAYQAPLEVADKSDADQLMAKFIAQERRVSKPFSKQKAYVVMGSITLFILFLMYLMM